MSDGKFMDACITVADGYLRIHPDEWEILQDSQRKLMNDFYKQKSQDDEAVMERTLLFIEYVKQYGYWCDHRAALGKSEPLFWQYINSWKLDYNNIETYFILKHHGIAFPMPKYIADLFDSTELDGMAEVLTVKFKHNPQSDIEWVHYWTQTTKKTFTGQRAQANFLNKVHKYQSLLVGRNLIENRYELVNTEAA